MSSVEVSGHFVFSDGRVVFRFGDQEAAFSEIDTMEKLRAVLVAIAQRGMQDSVASILGGGSGGSESPQNTFEKANRAVMKTIERSEEAFHRLQEKNAAALAKAQETYENATANASNACTPNGGK